MLRVMQTTTKLLELQQPRATTLNAAATVEVTDTFADYNDIAVQQARLEKQARWAAAHGNADVGHRGTLDTSSGTDETGAVADENSAGHHDTPNEYGHADNDSYQREVGGKTIEVAANLSVPEHPSQESGGEDDKADCDIAVLKKLEPEHPRKEGGGLGCKQGSDFEEQACKLALGRKKRNRRRLD